MRLSIASPLHPCLQQSPLSCGTYQKMPPAVRHPRLHMQATQEDPKRLCEDVFRHVAPRLSQPRPMELPFTTRRPIARGQYENRAIVRVMPSLALAFAETSAQLFTGG